mmetsp:Transcript_34894/g.100478  ORF Transcript_34894/g.100478 Transcript_34894/m.100478 type:complete len:814 (-) Transcript_34894:45-2486(-)
MPVRWAGPPAEAALFALKSSGVAEKAERRQYVRFDAPEDGQLRQDAPPTPRKPGDSWSRLLPGGSALLSGGGGGTQDDPILRQSPFRRTILALMPWFTFVLITYLFIFSFEDFPQLVRGIVALCAVLAGGVMLTGVSMPHGGTALALGAWALSSLALAVAIGRSLHGDLLGPYWQIRDGGVAEDVDPLEQQGVPPGIRAPAAFAFASDTFVDDHRTVGVVEGGHVYCVAPVAQIGAPSDVVSYWAVGVDCCETRRNFDCGSSRDTGMLTAMSFRSADDERFRRATRIASSVWGATSDSDARFVRFVDDVDADQDAWWNEAMSIALLAFLLHLAWTGVLAVVIARSQGGRGHAAAIPSEYGGDALANAPAEMGPGGGNGQPLPNDPLLRGGGVVGGRKGGSELALGDSLQDSFDGNTSPTFSEAETLSSEKFYHKLQELFDKNQDNPKFFNNVVIANDGGFSEVEGYFGTLSWKSILAAAAVPGLMIFNLTYMTITDTHFLRKPANKVDDMYLISTNLVLVPIIDCFSGFFGHPAHVHFRAQEMFAIFEITGMMYYLTGILWVAARLPFYPMAKKWISVYELYWEKLPKLSTYSLMGYLGPITPSVLLSEFESEMSKLFYDGSLTAHNLGVLVRFVLKRVIFAIIGFDAFLVKFRISAAYVDTTNFGWWEVMGAANFVMQLLGIVKTGILIQRRLFVFMFAGEDCVLDPQDVIQMKAYNALLAQKIWKSTRNWFHFNVVMLSFDDLDFQKLVLNTHHEGSSITTSSVDKSSKSFFGGWRWPWQSPPPPPVPPPAGAPGAPGVPGASPPLPRAEA